MTQLNDKTILITGATGGIGLVSAQELAKMGASLVLVGRNAEKVQQAVQSVRQQAGNERVEGLVADLSSQDEVRRLANEFKNRYGRLDVLLNNAGAIFMKREVSADGLEMTFALNHLSYFLLTNLLLDLLRESPAARIVNVSSAAHVGSRLDFDNLQNERGYASWKAYSQSKLMNLYFTYELARRLQGSNLTANALHPGFVATNFGKSNGGIFRPIFRLFQVAAISPQEGAKTSVYLASSPQVAEVTGKYFIKEKPVSSSRISYDQEIAHRLWQVSEQLCAL